MRYLLFLLVFLAGCAQTPENRQLWQAIGAGMQGAAQEINNRAAEMRNSINQQPIQVPRTTNCTTRYNSLTREYETTCF